MSLKSDFEKVFKDNVVGAQIAIIKDNNLYKYNYGYKSIEKPEKVKDDTIFRIASISKIIVTMAALKLQEEGLLNIDDDLSNVFGFKIRNPKFLDVPITIKMLMLHTSSISDGYDDENPAYDNLEKGYNGVNGRSYFVPLSDLLSNQDSKYYSDNTYLNQKPGTNLVYSNFGTGILACVIEKISGMLFCDFVEKYILKPLDLDASFKANNIIKKSNISDTFSFNKNLNEFKTMRTNKSFIAYAYPVFPLGDNFRGPAGGLFISMQDLSKLMMLLMNDGKYQDIQILNKDTVDLMLQMHYLGQNKDYPAKGLQLKFIDPFSEVLLKGHTGGAYGVSSYMFFLRENNLGICFIANGGKYEKDIPGFNNIQANVLRVFMKHFYNKKRNIIVRFNINTRFAYYMDRKIILNECNKENDELSISLIDFANLLNTVPDFSNNKVYIYNKEIEVNDNKIRLFKTLKYLGINYVTIADNLEIYL